jgi:hypothetical protein
MLGNAPFYNRTIRKIVVAFGTVFNDIYLVRYTKDGLTAKETIKVPLNWGAKEKYITRLTSDPTLTKSIATCQRIFQNLKVITKLERMQLLICELLLIM